MKCSAQSAVHCRDGSAQVFGPIDVTFGQNSGHAASMCSAFSRQSLVSHRPSPGESRSTSLRTHACGEKNGLPRAQMVGSSHLVRHRLWTLWLLLHQMQYSAPMFPALQASKLP